MYCRFFPIRLIPLKHQELKKQSCYLPRPIRERLSTPAIVSLNSLKTEEDMKTFNRQNIPIAVLLEGKFNSLYANRISAAIADTLAKIYQQPFLASSVDNKMIVISDADIVANVVTQNEGPETNGI